MRFSSRESSHRRVGPASAIGKLCLFAGTLVFAACSGSDHPPVASASSTPGFILTGVSDGAGEIVATSKGPETGATAKIVAIPGGTGAAIALFPDGRAYYSPDGFNLAGGGSTVPAYGGPLQVINVVAVNTGVDALLSDGTVFFSPDGMNLGGGGSTVRAYTGTAKIVSLTSLGGGVDAVFANNGGAYFSPDGQNLGGGGASVHIYAGQDQILQIVPVGAGEAVVALFQGGAAFYSPNNRDLGGGGNTVAASTATQAIRGLVKVGGGVLTDFSDGQVYLSPDGLNLAGGGTTIKVPPWSAAAADGPFAPRDSAAGAKFAGRLWFSGGFSDASNMSSCFETCSYFDLWSSSDLTGAIWNGKPSFATATSPNPRDVAPVEHNGVQDAPVPTDFYDSYSPIVVWNGSLWAIGRTVWHSADGLHWARQNLADGTAAPGPAPVRASENSRAVILGAALFFVQTDTGVVHGTTDPTATSWTDFGAIAGFPPRCGAMVFVLSGKIWIEGGGACDYSRLFNDVWSSADGVMWTRSAKSAEWSARMWACIAPGDDGIVWLAGGYAPTDWTKTTGTAMVRYGANHSDVWYSKDGARWAQLKADYASGLPDGSVFEPRHAATCYVAAGSGANATSLVAIAGTGGPDPNDANARVINSIRTLPLPVAATLP